MDVYILRGGSGSGKSTWARKNFPDGIVVSADQFMVNEDGVYEFDYDKLKLAHPDCVRRFVEYCQKPHGKSTLIVDNTNTMVAEFGPYVGIAGAYGHTVQILTFLYDPVEAWRRNAHGTPLKTCIDMHARIQEGNKQIPPWWKHDYIMWDMSWPQR